MRTQEIIGSYLAQATRNIHSAHVRREIVEELGEHLHERADALIRQGATELESARQALEEFGDPVELGRQLAAIHNPRLRWYEASAAIALALLLSGGGLPGYLDVSAALFVGAGAGALWASFCMLRPGRWRGRSMNVAKAFVLSGLLTAALSLAFMPRNGPVTVAGWQIILLPLFYGLLPSLLLKTIHFSKG